MFEIGKHDYHALGASVEKEVSAHLWFDNAHLSTVYGVGSEKERRRRPGKKSTNAMKARRAFDEEQEKDMVIALCINDYNRHMGGVDTADQLRCYYYVQSISWRTWWPMHVWAYGTMF